MANEKISNPLQPNEREFLLGMSKFTKEEDILEGGQRRILYSTGRYDDWFLNQASKLYDVLIELTEFLDGSEKEIADNIINKLAAVDPNFQLLIEVNDKGKLSPQGRLALAEEFERRGQLKEAEEILIALQAEHPENETVDLALKRVKNPSR